MLLSSVLRQAAQRAAQPLRKMSSAVEAAAERYPGGVQAMHWISGGSMLSCVGLVLAAQNLPGWKKCTPEEKKQKGDYMFYHKSFGALAMCMVAPRLALRLAQRAKIPPAPEGHFLEQMAGKVSHLAMYGFVIGLPVTGVAMGMYGGKGVPFFATTITPFSGEIGKAKDGKLAGKAYKLHKQLGGIFEYMVPIHVGAVGVHALKGQNLIKRITPFFK